MIIPDVAKGIASVGESERCFCLLVSIFRVKGEVVQLSF